MNTVLTAEAETAKKRINYKSDFNFRLHLYAPDGVEMQFPDYDFEGVIYTGSMGFSARKYSFSQKNNVRHNCYNDNGVIHVICDNHGLLTGQLYVEFRANVPNSIYPDGKEFTVTPSPLGIELVTTAGDEPTEIDEEIVMPVVYRSAYDMAVKAGYKGTYESYVNFVLANATGNITVIGTSGQSFSFGMFNYTERPVYYYYYDGGDESYIIGEFDDL